MLNVLLPLLLTLTAADSRAALPAKCVSGLESAMIDERDEARVCLQKILTGSAALEDRFAAANLLWGTSSEGPAFALLSVGRDSNDDAKLRGYCLRRLYWDVEMLSSYDKRQEIEAAMLALAKGGDSMPARRGAIWGLFSLSNRPTVQPTLLALAKDSEPAIRYEAVRSLFLAMQDDKVFGVVIDRARSDGDHAVRFAAILALSMSLDRPVAVDLLNRLARGSDSDATAAALALAGPGEPGIVRYMHIGRRDAATQRYYPPAFE